MKSEIYVSHLFADIGKMYPLTAVQKEKESKKALSR